MTKKQKTNFIRILVSAVLVAAIWLSPLTGWLEGVLYLIPYFIIGYDILLKAVKGIFCGQVFDENFLMAVATVGAMALGDWREGCAVMVLYQVGELFQSYAVGKSRRSISDLMDIRPDYANIEQDGALEKVDPDDVEVGTVIVVQPGERIPIDGVVTEGESAVNTSALTGESLPRQVKVGDEVLSGCVNLSGLLHIRTTKEFGDSTVAKILDLVENSSMKKAKAENFITKFARVYTPAVCGAALALAVLPPLVRLVMGSTPMWGDWVNRALTFLVISCPCALVISIPLSFFGGIGGASRCGILVKGGNDLESLAHIDTVVFDKTGTLTKGTFAVAQVSPAPGIGREELLEQAALAESFSSHPISKSLREAAGALDTRWAANAREIAGQGVCTRVDGHTVLAGNARMMEAQRIDYRPNDGVGTVVYVARDGVFLGSVLIADEIKENAKAAIDGLRAARVRTVMLTGDSEAVAGRVGEALGLDEVHAQLLPDGKVQRVEELMANRTGRGKLAFAGDGINDAPVLMRADVGIAMGAMGSDAAIEAADVVLMDDDPAKITLAMGIARKCMRIVYENIVFALGVKAVCLILGAMGIANMWSAVFADVGVMVLAVLNAMRLLAVKKS